MYENKKVILIEGKNSHQIVLDVENGILLNLSKNADNFLLSKNYEFSILILDTNDKVVKVWSAEEKIILTPNQKFLQLILLKNSKWNLKDLINEVKFLLKDVQNFKNSTLFQSLFLLDLKIFKEEKKDKKNYDDILFIQKLIKEKDDVDVEINNSKRESFFKGKFNIPTMKVKVLKDSKFMGEPRNKNSESVKKDFYRELNSKKWENLLSKEGNFFKFLRDSEYYAPSPSAYLCLNGNIDGWNVWKIVGSNIKIGLFRFPINVIEKMMSKFFMRWDPRLWSFGFLSYPPFWEKIKISKNNKEQKIKNLSSINVYLESILENFFNNFVLNFSDGYSYPINKDGSEIAVFSGNLLLEKKSYQINGFYLNSVPIFYDKDTQYEKIQTKIINQITNKNLEAVDNEIKKINNATSNKEIREKQIRVLKDYEEILTKIRINNSDFRRKLIKEYDKCPVKLIKRKELLIASHIVDYKDYKKGRHDYNNGLLLTADIDKLFDRKLITFDHDDGKLIICDEKLKKNTDLLKKCNILNYKKLPSILLTEERKEYLKMRNKMYFTNYFSKNVNKDDLLDF